MNIEQALSLVRKNAVSNQHRNTKLRTIIAEVGELAYALDGKHEHPPELELVQIAGICVNWLVRLTTIVADTGDDMEEIEEGGEGK